MAASISIPDDQLVSEAQAGSEAAFRVLFERYYDLLHGYAWKILSDEAAAEDVTQQTFIKVAAALRKGTSELEFRPWIYKIALNSARDQIRSRDRYQKRLAAISGEKLSHNEEHHRFEQVALMLESLPDEICQTVLLVFGQGLTQKESAAVMGCPIGTISWRISEARKTLRQQWEHYQQSNENAAR